MYLTYLFLLSFYPCPVDLRMKICASSRSAPGFGGLGFSRRGMRPNMMRGIKDSEKKSKLQETTT